MKGLCPACGEEIDGWMEWAHHMLDHAQGAIEEGETDEV